MSDFFDEKRGYTLDLLDDAQEDLDFIVESMEKSTKTTQRYIGNFEGAVNATLELIEEAPYLSRGLHDGDDVVRYKSIPKFDYAVYFEVIDDTLEVLAFAFIPERAGARTIEGLLNERIHILDARKKVQGEGTDNA